MAAVNSVAVKFFTNPSQSNSISSHDFCSFHDKMNVSSFFWIHFAIVCARLYGVCTYECVCMYVQVCVPVEVNGQHQALLFPLVLSQGLSLHPHLERAH